MKSQTLKTTISPLLFLLFIPVSLVYGQVGINTTTPSETLHVNGNVRIDGEIKPGNQSGNVDQVLLSQGVGATPSWGPGFLNTAQINSIGKFYISGINSTNGTYIQGDVTDANMTTGATVTITLIGNLPAGPVWGFDFTITPEARNGVLRLHIANNSGFDISGLTIAYSAIY